MGDWWAKDEDVIWLGTEALRGWKARFLWDDGSGTWGLAVSAPGEERREANAWWHYDVHSIDTNGESLPDVVKAALRQALRERSLPTRLTTFAESVLASVVTEGLNAVDRRATAKEIRFAHGSTPAPTVNRALDSLVPLFASRARNAWGEDSYRATLSGLLHVRKADTEAALLAPLDALDKLYRASRRVRLYSAHEVNATSLPRFFLGEVVHAATLHEGWEPERWNVPVDIEEVAKLRNAADFMKHARESGTVPRAWPTAPVSTVWAAAAGIAPASVEQHAELRLSPGPSALAREGSFNVTTAAPPVVFISYSHDSESHKEWVRQLAHGLRTKGIDAILDQWDLNLGDDMGAFMERIAQADRVLLVCSASYVDKANQGKGGVGFEKLIVTKEVIGNAGTDKFIPIVRNNPGRLTPTFLGARLYVDFENDAAYQDGFDKLLRKLHGVPKNPKPPIGPSPFRAEAPTKSVADENEKPAGISLSASDTSELERLVSELAERQSGRLHETNRQKAARASLAAAAEHLNRRGLTASLEQLPEGTRNAPRAFHGLALPLLVLKVDQIVAVLDDALNGLYCYVVDASELERPLPKTEGWIRIDDPAKAHLMVLPLVTQRLAASMMTVPSPEGG